MGAEATQYLNYIIFHKLPSNNVNAASDNRQ